MVSFFSRLKSLTSPYLYWLLLLHFIYLYNIHVTESMGGFYFNFKGISLILASFIPVISLFYSINFCLNRYPKGVILGNISLLFFYGLLAGYHFHARTQFIWDMFIDNVGNALYLESVIYMWNSIDKEVFVYFLVFVGIFIFMQWRYRSITRFCGKITTAWPPLIALGVYSLCLVTTIPTYDPVSGFLKSMVVYYFKSSVSVNYEPGTYPLLTTDQSRFDYFNFPKSISKKPNIFLIVVESLNQSIINKNTDKGEEITPFLNKLSKSSLVVPQFYANSIQSARGHVSIFLSLMPSIANKITTQFSDLTVLSTADVMKKNGYKSVLFHAYKLDGFDNTEVFFRDRGFQMETVGSYIKQEEDAPYLWRSWGPEDNVFFKRFFDFFDRNQSDNTPGFYSLITVASHFPFSSVPEHRRLLFKNPSSIHEEYANSLHLVDRGIAVFFDELKKRNLDQSSIVIITSDHTIPMGEHGIYHQEVGYFEESFRIPLYIHWPEGIKPQVIEEPYSQMDITPTIFDLIDAEVPQHAFMGRSIFSKNISPVYLIQPYGKQFSVIKWPYKFIWHERSRDLTVYDLVNDPKETKNIVAGISEEDINSFKQDLTSIYRNQLLYTHNTVYKP